MTELEQLKSALAFSVSAIAAEHFFSAGMSSPWSVDKFATTPEDADKVWKLFSEAAVGSMLFSGAVGLMFNSRALWWALGGGAAIVLWMYWDYKRALEHTL